MKDILEKRVQELAAQVKADGDAYNAAQADIQKLANDYNVAVIKLQEAQELLANVVKAETECRNAVCEQEASSVPACTEAGSS